MIPEQILGTAGHIDHGKTALVRALTGTDCDRLPEERDRGITIDIGFARLDLDDGSLGIIDVPGHERFVRNMLAGAAGIDLALLVIAADDSVMPQSREHLEILQLLGIGRGAVAVTKADLVSSDRRAAVADEIRHFLRGSFLADAPLVFTSVITGEGIDELKNALADVARSSRLTEDAHARPFRLAVDRSFVVQGHGTIVTGSVTSGRVRVGDELEWLPRRGRVRVRSLQNHGRPVDELGRGSRAAINLTGVAHDEIVRGHELATPGYLLPSAVLTATVRASVSSPRPLNHRQPVRLHIGAAEVMGVLALLDADTLRPGEPGLAQLLLDEPVVAVWGQPFVIRDSSAMATIGGGRVLQPVPRKFRRRHHERVEALSALVPGTGTTVDRVAATARFAGTTGIVADDLPRDAGIAPADTVELLAEVCRQGILVELAGRHYHSETIAELERRMTAALRELHEAQPLLTTHPRSKVEGMISEIDNPELARSVADRLIRSGAWLGDGPRVALTTFRPKLSANQMKLKDRIVAECRQSPFRPPVPSEVAKSAGGLASGVPDLFAVAAAEGLLVRIAPDLYLACEAEAEMRRRVAAALAYGGRLTVAQIRDLLGTTRKYAVPFCEYLDQVGVTRREGDFRVSGSATADG